VDIVNLANNHSRNYGQPGLEETEDVLNQKGILATGVGNLVKAERKDTVFGFLGFDLTVKYLSVGDLELIKASKDKVDVLVVGVHWGSEYRSEPSVRQREWAKQMIISGADVIVGHHPHWVQSFEFIEGKPVYYSLGNFVFDQMWSVKTREGAVAKLTFKDGKLIKQEFLKTYMTNWAQPEFMTI